MSDQHVDELDVHAACSCLPNPSGDLGACELFFEGDDLYDAMVKSIENASSIIRLESFIFADDPVGRRFAETLAQRANDGVKVRLLLDAAGSFSWFSRDLEYFLRSARVDLKWFRRWSWTHPGRFNRRNHRKLLVIDDEEIFLGGFNIHKENSERIYGEGRIRDTQVRTQGPITSEAIAQFDAIWNDDLEFRDPGQEFEGQILISNIFRNCRRRFHCVFHEFLSRATSTAYLTTPYFVPDSVTQRALAVAAQRGVDVRLLVPAKADVGYVSWAASASYGPLLAAGVRIFEYEPRQLHAKTAVIDSRLGLVGSANMDYRSFFLNYEICLLSSCNDLTMGLVTQFVADLAHATEVDDHNWLHRHRTRKIQELIGWTMRRWL